MHVQHCNNRTLTGFVVDLLDERVNGRMHRFTQDVFERLPHSSVGDCETETLDDAATKALHAGVSDRLEAEHLG